MGKKPTQIKIKTIDDLQKIADMFNILSSPYGGYDKEWFLQPNARLDNQTPWDALKTEEGRKLLLRCTPSSFSS